MNCFLDQAPRLLDHVHYSKKYNYVYVDTPKVACSTIKNTLQRAEAASHSEHHTHSYNNPYGYSDFLLGIHDRSQNALKAPSNRPQLCDFIRKSHFVFCFVRNPYTRVLSAYIDKIRGNSTRRALFMKELGVKSSDPNKVISFIEFLELIEIQTPISANSHWRHQYFHLMSDEIRFDFIGCFERFPSDFADACSKINPDLQSYNQTVDEHKTDTETLMLQYYSEEKAINLVRDIYHSDFKLFSYSDNPERATEPFRM